ncbi:unnamed protein product [Peronospora belbahrii]|uniref:Chromo domain-containing protein n=1 Tax=Peronospora belbahrii TaxID=622444 RepID=A0AAU9L1E3_9STRA|nr:unnamed protein product [Peronospora belbahrii]
MDAEGVPEDHGSMGHRPPPTLTDDLCRQQLHVERLLARRCHQGHTQYLVKWRGYPQSYDSWEYEVPLRQDCPDVVEAFDQGRSEAATAVDRCFSELSAVEARSVGGCASSMMRRRNGSRAGTQACNALAVLERKVKGLKMLKEQMI